MRLLFVNPSLYAIGGMQAWLDVLMPALATRGHEVWLGLPSGRFNDAAAYLDLHPWEPRVLLENPTGTRLGRRAAVRRALARARPDVVVVAHVAPVYETVAAMRAAGEPTPRVVSFLHSISSEMFEDLRTFRSGIDALAGPNRLVPAAAAELGFIEPERAFYAPGTAEVLQQVDLDGVGTRVELAYAGRFEDTQKRVRELPELLHRLDERGVDWSIDVAGVGSENEWLRAELARPAWSARVRWHGALSPGEVQERVLRPGRVLLILSNWELGPAIAWEALGRGLVVVTSNFVGSGVEDALRDGESCLRFPVGDLDAAAAAVGRLADVTLRRRLALAARETAQRRYAPEVGVTAWDRLLRGVTELPPRAPARPLAIAPSGRLDRWLGLQLAELVRRVAWRPVTASGPGDEWPHTQSAGEPQEQFFERVASVDRGPVPEWLVAENDASRAGELAPGRRLER